jgi:putative ABC transport system permease protein
MFGNYIKVALRYLLRNRQYTIINVSGLAIAIAAGILIIQFVRNELTYDRFNTKSERIVRLWQEETYNAEKFICTTTPYSAASELKASYPEIENFTRVHSFQPILKYGQRSFSESARMVDSTFFKVFDFEILKGSKEKPFPSKSSVLLTEEIAAKLFGKEEALGKTIQMSLNNTELPFIVSGIVKKAPSNSSVKFNCLIPYTNSKYLINESSYNVWSIVSAESYLVLKQGTSVADLEKRLPSIVKKHFGQKFKEGAFIFHLQPLPDIHLNSDIPAGIEPISDIKYCYILSSIGFLLLLVASVNFIILSLGRSVSRYREVGVRKVLGAVPIQLVRQYWGESLILTMLAGIAGFLLAWFSFTPFKYLVSTEFAFKLDLAFFGYAFLLIVVIAMLAGIYPAFVLSKHRPAETIRNTVFGAGKSSLLQDVLITGQLVVSIALIICTFIVRRQMDYIGTKDLGYRKDRLVVIESHKRVQEGFTLCKRLKNELSNDFEPDDYTCSFYSFVQSPWFTLGFTQPDKVYKGFRYNSVDARFIPAMGLKMSQGRNFIENDIHDEKNSAIVNESFVEYFNLEDPIGKKVPGPFHPTIIGVVKDFNYMPLREKIEPLLLTIQYDSVLAVTENISLDAPPDPRLTVRLPEGRISDGIARLESIWKKVVPGQQFDFKFVDEGLMAQYENEKRMSAVAGMMAGLSIFVACLGLFGLATLNVTRRTKEIGIRKVLGASNAIIVWILSSRIVQLVFIAAIITAPLTWYVLKKWLADFAYHTSIDWKPFAFSAILTLVVALITISFQTLKAARENPVNSLKTE